MEADGDSVRIQQTGYFLCSTIQRTDIPMLAKNKMQHLILGEVLHKLPKYSGPKFFVYKLH